jgi:hypothetical protein
MLSNKEIKFNDLDGGRNRDITAGADLTFLTLLLIKPSLEVRGTYPSTRGKFVARKTSSVGPKVEFTFGRLYPYADIFLAEVKLITITL